jgi:hypothetical protein
MDWETEEFGSNINEPIKSKLIHSPRNNIHALGIALGNTNIRTRRPNTGDEIMLPPELTRKVTSYLAPAGIRMTPVTGTPKRLNTFIRMKNRLPAAVKKMSTIQSNREMAERKEQEEEVIRAFQREQNRKRNYNNFIRETNRISSPEYQMKMFERQRINDCIKSRKKRRGIITRENIMACRRTRKNRDN